MPSETGFVHASSSIDGRFDEDSTSRSLLVETLGILLLIYVFAVPIYLGLRLTLIVAPMLHLLLYIVFKRLFMLSTTNDCCQIYSLVYYRWWFLRRLWKLNEPWLYMIQGTSLYNSYLRLCGARIGVDVNLRTSLIDLPDLLEIGDNSLVGEDVVLSSMTYESEKAFRLTSIHIGARCRIGARSVLHSKVHIGDQVFAKPLTPMGKYINSHQFEFSLDITLILFIAGNIVDNLVVNGYEQVRRFETYEVLNEAPVSMFNSSLGVCAVWLIHECLLRVALVCSQSYWPLTCLIWLLGCISILLITLKWLPSSIESWWIRQLLVTAFGFAIPLTFEGDGIEATEHIYPRLVRWLGRSSIGQNVRSGTITNLLTIRRHLLDVGMNVMLGADIFFDDGNGIIRIGDGASLGNDCLIQADAHIPPSASVGSMTRVDSSPGFTQSNQVIIGIPARQTMLFAPVRPIDNVFQRNVISYLIIKLIFIRFLSLLLIFSIMHITILPMSIIVFSLIVCILYSLKFDSSLMSHLTLTLVNDFNLFVGPFIGGTQWLNIVLNALGATIHRTAIIADIDCINDPRLIRISSHVRIDQRARVQVSAIGYLR